MLEKLTKSGTNNMLKDMLMIVSMPSLEEISSLLLPTLKMKSKEV